MRSFEEIINDCLKNRENSDFNKYVEELCKNDRVKYMINVLSYDKRLIAYKDIFSIEDKIGECIFLVLCKAKAEYINKFVNFKYAVVSKIRDELKKEKNRLNYDITDSLDAPKKEDSSLTILDTIKDKNSIESKTEYKENAQFLKELIDIGIVDKKQQKLFLQIYNIEDLCELKSVEDLINKLNNKDFNHIKIRELLRRNSKRSKTIAKMVRSIFSFNAYTDIVQYLINNKKLKEISELVIDFNKIRNYLSILFSDNSVNNKSTLVERSMLKESSYEKNIHRILSLFHKLDKNIFDIRDDFLNKRIPQNKFFKVFETHIASNLVSNFLIIDILGKYKDKDESIKLSDIMDELFLKVDYKEENKNNFRKYNLLPRLNELKEYGFVTTINNDKYSLEAKFLTDEQKKSLEYVVPFFCGLYPFSSIGHFLANRLNTKNLFEFESFNLTNVLDDCITYDLLDSINNNQTITLNMQKDICKNYKPKAIILDKNKNLLKVLDNNEKEYFLKDIINIEINKKKPGNPVFSEIYSYYYKIFEELIKKYKENPNYNITEVIDKYGSDDTYCNIKQIKEILPKLAKLKHTTIPLTKLELQWLKTIMQDTRFDLFVSEEEKQSLNHLVENIEPFDLTSFRVYDSNKKIYKTITDANVPKGIDKDLFRKQLKELNSALFSVQKNSFEKLNYKKD